MAAVAAGRRRASSRCRRSIGRSRASAARPRCTPASATPHSCTTGRPATRSSTSWPAVPRDNLAIEAAQPRLDPRCCERSPARPWSSACSTCPTRPVETPEVVAERIAAALTVIPPERLQVGPDCGMKYLPRDVAFAKLRRSSRARGWRASASSSRANCGWVGRRGSISSQSPRRARSVLRNSPIASTSSHGARSADDCDEMLPGRPTQPQLRTHAAAARHAPARAPRAARRNARRCR